MRNLFMTSTPAPKHPRDAFDLSHEKKLSFKFGQLIPIYWDNITPGDSFRVSSEIFIRLAPMLSPVLHRIDVFTHYFWVPYRLCMPKLGVTYADWEGFITGDPESEFTNEELPYVTMGNAVKSYFEKGDLPDYFGLPVLTGTPSQTVDINVLPFFAYQLIFDNYYRDENLVSKTCGPTNAYDVWLIGGDRTADVGQITEMRYRAFEKDYFTGSLPTAYAGSSGDVELDLDIFGNNSAVTEIKWTDNLGNAPSAGDPTFAGGSNNMTEAGPGQPLTFREGVQIPGTATLEIYELRRAQALVRSLEAEKRGGHRYVEMLLGKFGVISDDYRTAIPQYLGGGKQNVQISSVMSTTQALDPTAGVNDGAGGVPVTIDPQANMSGMGISIGKTNRFQKSFNEHGIVIGIMSVIPRTAYQDGVENFWRKENRHDFFDPYLQRIGDQEIKQSEVWFDQTGTDKDDVFGYAPRWAEYKFKNSSVHGDFRDDFDYWHMGRKFSSAPSLNETFITATPTRDELNRIFAVETASVDKLYAQIFNKVTAIRPMLLHDIPI